MTRPAVPAAALLVLAACIGTPQGLPVSLSICKAVPRAGSVDIVTDVGNRSSKPISRIDLVASFYQDFRYRKYEASASLARELDPGEQRRVTLAVTDAGGTRLQGQAIHCYATHVGYLDGTADDAPPNQ